MLRVWSFMREGFTFSQALLITVIFAVLIAIFKGPVRKYMDGRRYVNKVRQSYIDLISKFGLQMTTDKVLAKFKEDKLGKLIYSPSGTPLIQNPSGCPTSPLTLIPRWRM